MSVILVEIVIKSYFSGKEKTVLLPAQNVNDGCYYSFHIPEKELITQYDNNLRLIRCESLYISKDLSEVEKNDKLKSIVYMFKNQIPYPYNELEINVHYAEDEKSGEMPVLKDITNLLFNNY